MLDRSDFKKIVAASRRALRPRLIEFYQAYVQHPGALIDKCYAYQNDDTPARILHTLERLVSLSDQGQDDQLRLFFLIVCAEALFKLVTGKRGHSRKSVCDYFDQYIKPEDRRLLESHFKRSLGDPQVHPRDSVDLGLCSIISVLYDVRNQTVHEGITYGFHFSDDGETILNWVDVAPPNRSPDIRVFETTIQYDQIRAIVVRTGIGCLQKYLSR
jgi:hypothetical protein